MRIHAAVVLLMALVPVMAVAQQFLPVRAKPPEAVPLSALTVLMINLLKDRFQLATHVETRDLPIFHLVMARADGRLGPDLKATEGGSSDASVWPSSHS